MGLYKRGKVWWMSFTYQGQQVRKSTETADRRLAEAILAKVKVKIVERRYFDVFEENERTYEDLVDRYMREYSAQKAPSTHEREQYTIKVMAPYFGKRTLGEITPKVIAGYKTQRRDEGGSPSTINRELALLRHAFNVAIKEWEWCRDNPVRRVAMERVNNARVRYLTNEEFERVLQVCPAWVQPLVLVARYTGLRRGNVQTLRWDQVDLNRQVLIVEQTKNGDPIGLPLCRRLVDLFESLRRVRHVGSPYIFSRKDGSPYPGVTVRSVFKKACRKAGIHDFRFHDLRHTFASSLVQRGVDLYQVQRLLGHRDAKMTQRYAHLAPENLREAVRVLDRGITIQSQASR
jgi:integrase